MTTIVSADQGGTRAATGRRRRIARLLRTEVLLAWRYRAIAATVGVTGLWVVVLTAATPPAREVLVPLVLLTDVTALGFLLIPALLVVERVDGVEAALRMTTARPAERVAVRLGVTTALSVSAALVVCAATGVSDVPRRVLGAALLSALLGLVAFVLTGGATTLTDVLTRTPLVAPPLVAPALAHLAGLGPTPALHVSPVTSAVDLLRGDLQVGGLAWQLAWILTLAVAATRVLGRPPAGNAAAGPADDRTRPAWPRHRGTYAVTAAAASFARADRRSLLRDGLLIMLVASVPLLAGVLRLAAGPGVAWTRQRYGVVLEPYLPLLEVLLLVVHTPVVFGALTGLLLLEDRDAGLFAPVTATRAGLGTLLGYRLTAAAALTTGTLLAVMPFDGVAHAAGGVGIAAAAIAAGAVGVPPALLMAAIAHDRVQGVAVMKVLGLPLYLPMVTWALDGPARWIFAPVPTTWTLWAAWASTPRDAVVAACGAVLASAVWAVPLARRVVRRVT